MEKFLNLDKPLTSKILSDPNHPITKHILYLYSMESFIYTGLNIACRKKCTQEIQYYGAFAAALSCIIYFANKKRKGETKLSGETILYRGIKLKNEQLLEY